MASVIGYKEIFYCLLLIIVNCLISIILKLKVEKSLIVATSRAVGQLLFLGYILHWIFEKNTPFTLFIVMMIMICSASWTAVSRVKKKSKGLLSSTFFSIFLSTTTFSLFTLNLGLPQTPWYHVENAIPLVGMILGNGLTGISLALDQYFNDLVKRRREIENYLSLGASSFEATHDILQQAFYSGLTPILNSMMIVGIVSIPGMMTGQILAGNIPSDAAKYQINILLIICANTFFSILGVLLWNYKTLFKNYHRFDEKKLQEIL